MSQSCYPKALPSTCRSGLTRYTLLVEPEFGQATRCCVNVDNSLSAFPYLQPHDLCDDAATAVAVGGVTAMQAKDIDEQRRDLAAHLAKSLTKALMESFKAKDTCNGYPQKP